MYSIEAINAPYFVDLGGLAAVDLNFEINKQKHFPLMIAAAKGR